MDLTDKSGMGLVTTGNNLTTDETLRHFHDLPHLKPLALGSGQITDTGKGEPQPALPDCNINKYSPIP